MVNHFGYLGGKLLAHDRGAQAQADIFMELQLERLVAIDKLYKLFVFGKVSGI